MLKLASARRESVDHSAHALVYDGITSKPDFFVPCPGFARIFELCSWIQYRITVSEPLSDTPVTIWRAPQAEEYASVKPSHVSVEAGQGNLLTNTHHGLHNIFRYRTNKHTLLFEKRHVAYARVEASLPSPSPLNW